jgi:ATP-dependent Lon protease
MENLFSEFIDLEDPGNVDVPPEMPMMPVRDITVFPTMIIPLFVGRESSIAAVNHAISSDRMLFLAMQKEAANENPLPEDIYSTGTAALIVRTLQIPDGRLKILAQAISRGRIGEYTQEKPFFRVAVDPLPDRETGPLTIEDEALMRHVRTQAEQLFNINGIFTPELGAMLSNLEDPGRMADIVASNLNIPGKKAQSILETTDPVLRLKMVNKLLARDIAISTVQERIQSEAREEMGNSQREYFLREQLRAIQKELGELGESPGDIEEYREKIREGKMPPEVEKEALKQLQRLETTHPDSSETSVIRTYLDWLVEMPWKKQSRDRLDIKRARKILDEDHYDLEKVKERILEYMAVRKLNRSARGPIICFVGPPGVGKTSLGRSIARALGRKFVRISLGGVRDEAEIRGHRRTYVGALPGRIIQGIKKAGTRNPVFMMDEVDKVGADFRGDPAAALLEVLDPEQNRDFSDHYLELPFDLSGVMFILTANTTDTIPSALYDRLEIIYLSGYTSEEKTQIAKKYLVPRQVRENGLKASDVEFSDRAIGRIISEYTEEAGLRELERKIGGICRKIALKIAEGERKRVRITRPSLQKYLGVPEYLPDFYREDPMPGIATGLAWTAYGGEMLKIEASVTDGKGNLQLTGLLGEVMKESAQAALTYARSRSDTLGIRGELFDETDLHIHVPSGAIPKDGPSAGITMATAMISALTDRPARSDLAMTGEITLRGRVMPVGGIKEKAMAALRADIREIIIPEQNRKDIEDIPANIRRKIRFIEVKTMDEVIELALLPVKKTGKTVSGAAKKQTRKNRKGRGKGK